MTRRSVAAALPLVALVALAAWWLAREDTLRSTSAAPASPAERSDPSADSSSRAVLATANIFGAGYRDAPGGGTSPPGWRLPAGSVRVVTFPRITGTVTPLTGTAPRNGPQGDRGALGSTDVESWRGISGIVDAGNGMFLVGVFLRNGVPRLPAPPRLDFTDSERFDTLAPLIGQTFFVGEGGGRRYEVPETATRLYLGFADAYSAEQGAYQGRPGYYANNAGHLEVAVHTERRGP
jgi:hypothetical protein